MKKRSTNRLLDSVLIVAKAEERYILKAEVAGLKLHEHTDINLSQRHNACREYV
ncbi:MAG: hypothetical protein OXL96_16040 [Candidatus Poribacteria bacterium]|nr:hypothetical protein [Candidatus Poribacteria bacterium]